MFLTHLLVSSLMLTQVAASNSDKDRCWVNQKKKWDDRHPKLYVYGEARCRSYCFDLQQQTTNGCDSLTTCRWLGWDHCYMATQNLVANPSNLKDYTYYVTWRMKPQCRFGDCWSDSGTPSKWLYGIRSRDEMHCKSICLETKECRYQAYDSTAWYNKCKVEAPKTPDWGLFRGNINYLSNNCKQEKCWTRYENWDISWNELNLVHSSGEFDCRRQCYIKYRCQVFSWNNDFNQCHIMKVTKSKPVNHIGKVKKRLTTYEIKEDCIDNQAYGFSNYTP